MLCLREPEECFLLFSLKQTTTQKLTMVVLTAKRQSWHLRRNDVVVSVFGCYKAFMTPVLNSQRADQNEVLPDLIWQFTMQLVRWISSRYPIWRKTSKPFFWSSLTSQVHSLISLKEATTAAEDHTACRVSTCYINVCCILKWELYHPRNTPVLMS